MNKIYNDIDKIYTDMNKIYSGSNIKIFTIQMFFISYLWTPGAVEIVFRTWLSNDLFSRLIPNPE